MQHRRRFTTMVDLDDFEKIEWTRLKNVTKQWEYDGMAYLFREAGIPIYGETLGTMRENHPFVGIMVPKNRDRNYGIDIFVPATRIHEARLLVVDEKRLRESAEFEQSVGETFHEKFRQDALAKKRERAASHKKSVLKRLWT